MAIRIHVDGEALARSRFACSPAVEVVMSARARGSATDPAHHTARWNTRARATMEPGSLALLHALTPVDHPYTPDFLNPRPPGSRASIEQAVEAIAATPPEIVDHHLDVALAGRPVRPEVAAQFGTERDYLAWRRPVPEALARVIAAGPRAVAEEAAGAVEGYLRHGIGDDWPLVRSLLDGDVAARAEHLAARGWASMLGELGGLHWTGSQLVLDRTFDGDVDWAHDGLLLVPCASHTGRALFAAERPTSPVITYAARGTAALRTPGARRGKALSADTDVGGLIGRGRQAILARLDRPRTTRDLSLIDGRSESTISYHLGVLARAGLVAKRRSGRGVAYHRTALADSLVGSGARAHEAERSST